MAQIKPFQAVVYNPKKVADMSKVVCPPYDVISPADQESFLARHPNNFIRLILGKIYSSDSDKDNRYTRSKNCFDQWLKEEILKRDSQPAIYFYLQEYVVQGEKKRRLGFIALMRLEEEESKVFLHENTHSAPKEDRMELLKQVKANLSPIFVLYSDKERNIKTAYENILTKNPPEFDVTDDEKVRHKLWSVTDQEVINRLVSSLNDKNIFIADGHHRYEVALNYSKLMRSQNKGTDPEAGYNYILSYFTNIDSKDLNILPFHRVIRNFPSDIKFLEEQFRVEKIKTKYDLLVDLAKAGRSEHAFGLYQKDRIYLLRLKNERLLDSLIAEGSKEYKRLDVTILKAVIFDCLNISSKDIIYTKDAEEAFGLVDKKEAQASLLLNPVKIEQLRMVALNNERMPPKSTYFYPKVLSGLVVNKFDL